MPSCACARCCSTASIPPNEVGRTQAAAVSRAARELHDDLATPIDSIIEEARVQQAAKVSALEAELEAARKVLADLD